jgi:hypothetical protein
MYARALEMYGSVLPEGVLSLFDYLNFLVRYWEDAEVAESVCRSWRFAAVSIFSVDVERDGESRVCSVRVARQVLLASCRGFGGVEPVVKLVPMLWHYWRARRQVAEEAPREEGPADGSYWMVNVCAHHVAAHPNGRSHIILVAPPLVAKIRIW